MSDGRKRLSGAEYRKKSKLKKEEQQHALRTTMEIENFFKSEISREALGIAQGSSETISKDGQYVQDTGTQPDQSYLVKPARPSDFNNNIPSKNSSNLLSDNNDHQGFNDWKNAEARVALHENSLIHKSCILALKARGLIHGCIQYSLTAQINEEIVYWRNILKRVVSVIKGLASRGLAFRGSTEKFGDPHSGNYIMLLE